MAWPPPLLPIDRSNATPQTDTHPMDHNVANLAINDIVAVLGTDPFGSTSDTVSGRIAVIENKIGLHGVKWSNNGQSIPATTVTLLVPGTIDLDTAGFTVNGNTMQARGTAVYALMVRASFTGAYQSGAWMEILSASQSVLAHADFSPGQLHFSCAATTLIADLDGITFRVYLDGTATPLVTTMSMLRVANL